MTIKWNENFDSSKYISNGKIKQNISTIRTDDVGLSEGGSSKLALVTNCIHSFILYMTIVLIAKSRNKPSAFLAIKFASHSKNK